MRVVHIAALSLYALVGVSASAQAATPGGGPESWAGKTAKPSQVKEQPMPDPGADSKAAKKKAAKKKAAASTKPAALKRKRPKVFGHFGFDVNKTAFTSRALDFGWGWRIELTKAPANLLEQVANLDSKDVVVLVDHLHRGAARLDFIPVQHQLAFRVKKQGGRLTVRYSLADELLEKALLREVISDTLDSDQEDVTRYLNPAEELLKKVRIDDAAVLYEKLQEQVSTRGVARLRLADISFLNEERDDAVKAYRELAGESRRRVASKLAALRLAIIDFYGPSYLEIENLAADLEAVNARRFGPNFALAAGRVLGALGRFDEGLDILARTTPPKATAPSFRELRSELLFASVRQLSVQGDALATATIYQRYASFIEKHPSRFELELIAGRSFLDLSLGNEAARLFVSALQASRGASDEIRAVPLLAQAHHLAGNKAKRQEIVDYYMATYPTGPDAERLQALVAGQTPVPSDFDEPMTAVGKRFVEMLGQVNQIEAEYLNRSTQ